MQTLYTHVHVHTNNDHGGTIITATNYYKVSRKKISLDAK